MKIEELLKELKIRFGEDWENAEISREVESELINDNSSYPTSIMFKGKGFIVSNRNGILHDADNGWATAKITEAPSKWVVQKDETNPIWKEFCSQVNNGKGFFGQDHKKFYHSNDKRTYDILDFEGYQYLTIEQWKHFFGKPKIDFSILNDEDVFCIYKDGDKYISKGNPFKCLVPLLYEGKTYFNSMSKVGVTKVCKATEEEEELFYKHFPELEPPNPGDVCILRNVGRWIIRPYIETDELVVDQAIKIDTSKTLDEIIKDFGL